jgi:hypothetical protein
LAPEEPTAVEGYSRLLRQSGFLKLFAAGIASVAGWGVAGVCFIWIIYQNTGSAFDVALYGVSAMLAGIALSLVGGTMVDRYSRKWLMVGADFGRAATVAVLVFILFVHGFNLIAVLLAIFIISSLSTLFNPAEQSVIPQLVGPTQIPDANGLVRSSRNAATFAAAAAAGGLIVTIGATYGIVVTAFTFLASGLLISLISMPGSGGGASRAAREEQGFLKDTREGISWLWRNKGFFQLTISATFFNFFSTIVETFLVFYATFLLHGSAIVFAGLLAAVVAGGGIGSLLVGRTGAIRYAGKAWVVAYGPISGALVLVFALFPIVGLAVGVMFLLGLCGGFAGTSWLSAAQVLVPSKMQGRYFGIDGLGSWAIMPVGQILGGVLIGMIGVGETYLLTAICWIIVGLAFLAPRALWNLGYQGQDLGTNAPSSSGEMITHPRSKV